MTRWLSAEQQQHWRDYITATTLLEERLARELQAAHGLTMADYEILVRLSDSPTRRLRMSQLAERSLASRSRLSHQIDRMERAGFVERQTCADDRRGAFAVMTDQGWTTLVAAAPDHVKSVRTHLVDQLSDEEFASLGAACERVAAHLNATQPA